MIRRNIDNILSEGKGQQLLWLFILTLVCMAISIFIALFIFKEPLEWQYVVGLFLDPGTYGSFPDKGHDVFRITVALLSVFLFSALLVSVFSNVFENISAAARDGKRRYVLKNHILIIGGGHHLRSILNQYKDSGKTIVVLSETKNKMDSGIIYYNGKRDNYDELKSTCIDKADTIYIIGEDNEPSHDAKSLRCMDFIKDLSANSSKDIHCYITIKDHETLEVFQYLMQNETGHLLLVDVINDYELAAEQLLVNTDFLPVIKQDENNSSHIIIFGTGKAAKAVAETAAHISHYPTGLKTHITFIGEGMRKFMDDYVISRPGLFELSNYTYVSPCGSIESHIPDTGLGDFLDVEWEFIDTYASSTLSKKFLSDILSNQNNLVTLYICYEDATSAISLVLHLPRMVYDKAYNIALYLNSSTEVIGRANQTGMYGKITIFGLNSENRTLSLTKRSLYGKRVNYIYDQAYGNPPSADEEDAWYKIPEAHKYSSIYCANAMFLRRKCFDMNADRLPIYEAEHRRWLMSELLMGFKTGEFTDKKRFIHADIIPFNYLSKAEQEKDKIIIDTMDYILSDNMEK